MSRRPLRLAALLLLGAASLQAQVRLGDSAWAAGDFKLARTAYENTLAENPGFARANYRVGILLSWDGNLDSALVMIGRARTGNPAEPAFPTRAAQVLSWKGELDAALALYDTVLAGHPDYHDALFGKARVLTWAERLPQADSTYGRLVELDSDDLDARNAQAAVSAARGDYDLAISRYDATLSRSPGNVEALTGIARTRFWMGMPLEARRQVQRALAVDPTYPPAQQLSGDIAKALRSRLDLTLGWSYDSDKNTTWWQTATINGPLAESFRGTATVGLLEASDPTGDGTRFTAEAGGTWSLQSTSASLTLGLRNLAPSDAASHTEGSGRLSLRQRFSSRIAVGGAVYWEPFDGTVTLLRTPVSLFAIDLDADITAGHLLSLGLGGGAGSTSDDNSRWSAVAVLMRQLGKGFAAGGAGRVLSYDHKGNGYFSPELYWFLEGRGTWDRLLTDVWEVRLAGGLGVQQIESASKLQSQFHAEARIARRLGAVNEVALAGTISNSAASSTTGAYRYYSLALSGRIGL